MWLRKCWRASQILFHLLLGVGQMYASGGFRQPFHPRARARVQRWYGHMLRILDVDIQVEGQIPHERSGAALLIANHISWVDIPLIGSLTPVNFLSKSEVAGWPLVGPLAKTLGTLFIDRGAGDTDQVMQTMHAHLALNRSVLVFPEGTTTDGSKVRRFHKKLFRVCEGTEVEVCPLLIHYSTGSDVNPVPFVGDVGFGSHFWQLLGHGRIRATVEVLPPVRLSAETVGTQMRDIEVQMRERLAVRRAGG